MKKYRLVAMIALVWMSFMSTMMGVLNEVSHQKSFAHRCWIVDSFCLSAIILGGWWLSKRQPGKPILNASAWIVGACVCAIPWALTEAWGMSIAAFTGMVIGSLIWSPRANKDTNQSLPVESDLQRLLEDSDQPGEPTRPLTEIPDIFGPTRGGSAG